MYTVASLVAQLVKNLPAIQETWVQSLGWEDPLEKGKANPLQYSVAHQGPPSMEFSRQEYWSALPFPSPGDLPNPGIEPRSPVLQAYALLSEPPGKPLFFLHAYKDVFHINFIG